MTRILCLETATSVCSVALFEEQLLIASREINEGFRHSEKLTVFIDEVMHESGFRLDELSAVAISSGPGSYTGLRIGMSVAKGICFASDVPLIAVPTLDIMAARASLELIPDGQLLCPMIDARRMEVYCGLYNSDADCLRTASAVVIDGNFLADIHTPVFFFGDGANKCRDILESKFIYAENIFPSARYMNALAFKKFNGGLFENVSLVEPVYLKEFHSKKN